MGEPVKVVASGGDDERRDDERDVVRQIDAVDDGGALNATQNLTHWHSRIVLKCRSEKRNRKRTKKAHRSNDY